MGQRVEEKEIVHAEHIRGVKNTKADARLGYRCRNYQQLAPHADHQVTLCQMPADLMMN